MKRPTEAQRKVLAGLERGDTLILTRENDSDSGMFDAITRRQVGPVRRSTVKALLAADWIVKHHEWPRAVLTALGRDALAAKCRVRAGE